jgi:hypothetical protein
VQAAAILFLNIKVPKMGGVKHGMTGLVLVKVSILYKLLLANPTYIAVTDALLSCFDFFFHLRDL